MCWVLGVILLYVSCCCGLELASEAKILLQLARQHR
jgi:cytochrome c oxidase assembly factor CtaG